MEKKILAAILVLAIVTSTFLFGCTYTTASTTSCGDASCNWGETTTTCPIDCGDSGTDSPLALPVNPDTGVEPTMPW